MNLSWAMIPILLMVSFTMMMSMKKISITSVICLINFMGMIPDFWCLTSYLWGNILMGLYTWSIFSLNKMFSKFKSWSSHLLPLGCPIFLWTFLIILEIISQLIRPMTLSLRLTCNLMAGHVMLSLISSSESSLIFLVSILMFEICVAVIQAIVFSLLLESYKLE